MLKDSAKVQFESDNLAMRIYGLGTREGRVEAGWLSGSLQLDGCNANG